MRTQMEMLRQAAEVLSAKTDIRPEIGMVLGSGWNHITGEIENVVRVPYRDVPYMARSTVLGHAGEFIFGRVGGKNVMVMNGRLHCYEGHSANDVVFPIRLMKVMGCEKVVLTNAAGAINTSFQPGDLMIITDHINLSGINPLVGPNEDEMGVRFPDMSCVYDAELRKAAEETAQELSFPVRHGVYSMMLGPSFETPAEIRMERALGADAAGMSTVPEAIAARHIGLRVLGLSCMTNMAAGILDQPLTHQEVLDTAQRVKESYGVYMRRLIEKL